MSKNRVFKPIKQAVDASGVKTSRGPLKGFPNHSMTLQSVFDDGNLTSSVNISNLDPLVQCEAGFRLIDQLCVHLSQTILSIPPDINNPTYRLLKTSAEKYLNIKELAKQSLIPFEDLIK